MTMTLYVFLLDIYYCSINIRLCSGKIWGQHLPATLLLQLLPAPMYLDYQWIPVIFMFRSTHFWRIWISLGMLWTSMMNPFTIWTWAYNFKSFEVVWTTQGLSCGDMKACKWVMKGSNVYAYLRSIQGPRSLLWSWHPDPENVETCRISSSCCKIWMSHSFCHEGDQIQATLINSEQSSNSQMQLCIPKAQRRAQILPPVRILLLVCWFKISKNIAPVLSIRPHVRQREFLQNLQIYEKESRIIGSMAAKVAAKRLRCTSKSAKSRAFASSDSAERC